MAGSYSYFLQRHSKACLQFTCIIQTCLVPDYYPKSCILEFLHYYSFKSTHEPSLGPAAKRKLEEARFQSNGNCLSSSHLRVQAGVDLNDHITSLRKDLKQLRLYFRVFRNMIMMATFKAFILKKSIKPHKNN